MFLRTMLRTALCLFSLLLPLLQEATGLKFLGQNFLEKVDDDAFGRSFSSSGGSPGFKGLMNDKVDWDPTLWDDLEEVIKLDELNDYEIVPLEYYAHVAAGNKKSMPVHPLKLRELQQEVEKVIASDMLTQQSMSRFALLDDRPDGLFPFGLFFMQEYRFTILIKPSSGGQSMQMIVRGDAAQRLQSEIDSEAYGKFIKRLQIIAQEHVMKTYKMFTAGGQAALEKVGIQYGVRLRTGVVCPTLMNTMEFNGMIATQFRGRIDLVQLLPIIDSRVESMGLSDNIFRSFEMGGRSAKSVYNGVALPPLPWRGVMLQGSVPLSANLRARGADRMTMQFMNYWVNAYEGQKGRTRKRTGLPRPESPRKRDALQEKYGSESESERPSRTYESKTLDFDKCRMGHIFLWRREYKTLHHCIVMPIANDRLFPDELAMIYLWATYPVGTKVIFNAKWAEGKSKFYFRQCEKSGWGKPLLISQKTFQQQYKVCVSSRYYSATTWGISALESPLVSSASSSVIPKAPPMQSPSGSVSGAALSQAKGARR